MERIEVDIRTGQKRVVQLTAEEVAAAQARAAAEMQNAPAGKRPSDLEIILDLMVSEGLISQGAADGTIDRWK